MPADALSERYRPIVADPDAFGDALQRPLHRFVWANPLKTSPEALFRRLARDGFGPAPLDWHPSAFRITGSPDGLGGHWTYFAGHFQIQEAGSMVPGQVLDAGPGMRVLDLCAAPGNKTAQAAVAVGNRGTVLANDAVGGRLSALRSNANRLGLLNVSAVCCDGTRLPGAAGTFDRVIVDAPCSCEGTTRQNPGVLAKPHRNRHALARRQALLLEQGVRRCRTGGRVVYSTCTYAPEENEGVVDRVLRRHRGALRVLPVRLPGLVTAPGIPSWRGRRYLDEVGNALRIWPQDNDTGGFFVAVLEKTDGPGDAGPPLGSAATGPAPVDDDRRRAVVAGFEERFGIPRDAFEGLRWFEQGRRYLVVAAEDHEVPAMGVRFTGLPLLHTRSRAPRMTTEAATLFGGGAARNRVDLSPRQLRDYLRRRDVPLSAEQIRSTDGPGVVLAGVEGTVIGNGVFRPDQGFLESQFPTKWL